MIQIILGLITSGNVQQGKISLGFSDNIQNLSVCQKIRRFLKKQVIDGVTFAKFLVSFPINLSIDRTIW